MALMAGVIFIGMYIVGWEMLVSWLDKTIKKQKEWERGDHEERSED